VYAFLVKGEAHDDKCLLQILGVLVKKMKDRMLRKGENYLSMYATSVVITQSKCFIDRTMIQAVSRWPLTAEARVLALFSPCEISGRQGGIGTRFSTSSSVFLVSIIPPLLHTHLSPPHEV
jgi:hypothetical protein